MRDVHYAYPRGEDEEGAVPDEALRGVSFSVTEGEFLCVIGHNGSGKSTLAKLMNALYLPSSGTVEVLGMDTTEDKHVMDIRRTVGLVLQNPDNQIVTTVVEEDVAFGLENLGVPPPEIRQRVDEALRAVGLSDRAKSAPHMLSGGQKQRVAIAGIVAMRPRVMVMDEPTAMLDPEGRAEVLETVERLRREAGMTLVMITHFMEEALRADRVLVMDKGQIAAQGTPREVLRDVRALGAAGMEPPFAVRMAERLKGRGMALPQEILTPEELVEGIPWQPPENPASSRSFRPVAASPALNGVADYASRPLLATERKSSQICSGFQEATRGLIQAKELSHIYMPGTPMQAVAVDKIDLEIGAGEFVGIIGHTGSGKTTLVQHMNGLLRATSGSIAVDGVEIPRKGGDMRAVRHVVGMVFQYPEYQLFEETVAKDVAFGPKNLGLSPDEVAERVREAMDSVGLPYDSFAERSPFELSGGQKRRAAIAGVLAMRPRVLALDEPTAGLDPHGREEILSLVRAFHRNGGTVVMISHSMDDVAEMCTRVIAMSGGRIAMQGTPQEVFSRGDELRALALDLPAAARVAEELAERGFATRGAVTMQALEDAIVRDLDGGADRGAD